MCVYYLSGSNELEDTKRTRCPRIRRILIKMRLRLLIVAAILLIAPAAFAGTYSLNDWCFYVNSLDVNRSCNNDSAIDNFSAPISAGTFDYYHLGDGNNTLGTAVVTLGSGSYNVFAIFDYDITGGGGMNEYATAFGSLAIGQVYAVDSQGASGSTPGQLYSQFAGGTLNNTNYIPECSSGSCPDVAVSLGYTNLVVPDGQTATVSFIVSDTPPSGGGFFIEQGQTGGGPTLNFSSNVVLTPDGGGGFDANVVATPEPGTYLMMAGGIGLMVLGLRRRRKA
jgi:hypothetical protein